MNFRSSMLRYHPFRRCSVIHFAVGHRRFSKLGIHDVGSDHILHTSLDTEYRTLEHWEKKADALLNVLEGKYFNVHELRRAIESMEKDRYHTISYYEKWIYATTKLVIEKQVITEQALHDKISQITSSNNQNTTKYSPRFKTGDSVRVRNSSDLLNWRQGHFRTPSYIHDTFGVIERVVGDVVDPELAAFGVTAPPIPLYRVRFQNKDSNDTIDVEVLQHWLEPVLDSHDHDHDDHSVMSRQEIEDRAQAREPSPSPYIILQEALEDLLVEVGVIDSQSVAYEIDKMDTATTSSVAPSLIAKAWLDDSFRQLVLTDGNAAVAEFGVKLGSSKLTFVENTPDVHNLIVCTLCSCYPRRLLGIPPDWYKSLYYRSEAIGNPRGLLKKEFGLNLGDDITLRVHDSTNELRYVVLPLPFEGFSRETNQEELESRITRDLLIGVKR